jgi:hypothetical protein
MLFEDAFVSGKKLGCQALTEEGASCTLKSDEAFELLRLQVESVQVEKSAQANLNSLMLGLRYQTYLLPG